MREARVDGLRRRMCLGTLAALWAGASAAHLPFGPVNPPVPAPEVPLTDHQGRAGTLRHWLSGRVTAVQTMFTGCSTVCPIQGALFAEVQRRLASMNARQSVQLMSVSIDALGDTPASLRDWLQRLQAQPGWLAAVPRPDDVPRLQRALAASATWSNDDHSNSVFIFDSQARLRWRSSPLPAPDEVLRAMAFFAQEST